MKTYDLDKAIEQKRNEEKCGCFYEEYIFEDCGKWQVETKRELNQPFTYEEWQREQELIAEIGF